MNNYIVCDTHCDTISEILDKGEDLFSNSGMLDIRRMMEYKKYIQFFAAFISPDYYSEPYIRCKNIIDYLKVQIEKNSKYIKLCTNVEDISDNKISAFISIEGGEGIKDIDTLYEFYKMGARMMTLTWNNDNRLAGGILGNGMGLTDFGRDVIKEMNKIGMIADVSHASEKTFYDIADVSEKPIIASHSDAFDICRNKRNLKKEQFEIIKKSGGVTGINFYPVFLNNSGNADVYDAIKHIEYFLSLGGEDNICIGSDFDGISSVPEKLEDASKTYKLFDILKGMGISDEIIQKIAYKNILRVMGICL